MAGLLSPQLARSAGLLGGLYAAGRESVQPQAAPAPALAPAPAAPPARRRPSLLETVWGMAAGYSPDAVADNYDQRARARESRDREDAMRPTLLARQDAMREVARSMGPQAMVAFEANPEEFGKSLSARFAPQVVQAGGAQVIDGRRTVEQPTFDASGDTTLARSSDGVVPVYTRTTPSIKEGIDSVQANAAMINATNPVPVSPNAILTDPRTGRTVAEGYRPPVIVGDGAMVFSQDGRPLAENVPRPTTGAAGNMTEAQAKDGFNASRMTTSGARIAAFEQDGFDFGASAVTGGQFRETFRQYEAAAMEWTDAMLRLTSGAQAPEPEVRSQMRAYFPQPGDSPAVRTQKAQMRQQAEAAAVARAGPGLRTGNGPVAVSTPAEAQALPLGTRYRTPDGREFIR